jgi:acyl-coenzyme A synthetase/AMP-(fatty) acid ligase
VVPATSDLTEHDLREEFERLRAQVPGRLRVCEMIVRAAPLPRTATGKVRRRGLALEVHKGACCGSPPN